MAVTKRRELFNKQFDNVDDKELMREVLYKLDVQYELQDENRSNTNKLVWFLVVIPYSIGIIYLIGLFVSKLMKG